MLAPQQKIQIPYKFEPRDYQLPLLDAMDSGYQRAVVVWHRRAGKDKTFLNLIVKKSQERVGNYYYYLPTGTQGRRILWDGIDKAGMPFMDHIPKQLIEQRNNQEMRIRFRNGSGFQILGTDRTEVVGPNPVGVVFSEFSLQNPKAWDYIRPILAENNGWAIFNFTPRGHNHAHRLFFRAEINDRWFTELLTVDDTQAISKEAIDAEIEDGMSEELAQQEFWCSWDYGLEGAYYLKQLARARGEDRVTDLPISDAEVFTAWDIGGDGTAIWFWQKDGPWYNLIDYYYNHGEGFAHYAGIIKDKPYVYGDHYGPHDIDHHGKYSGETYADRAQNDFGIEFVGVPKDDKIDDGIEIVRAIFPKCRFDKKRCAEGLDALNNYQHEYDEIRERFRDKPLHNWASHGADAFRYFARAVREYQTTVKPEIKARWNAPAATGQHGWMM